MNVVHALQRELLLVDLDLEVFLEELHEPIDSIVQAVKRTLERTPPELAGDLVESGMLLVGGGSQLRNIDKVLSEETGLPAEVASDPVTAVARGTGIVLEKLDLLKQILESGEDET